jgi:aerobic C4-dicarboxylate transport protein
MNKNRYLLVFIALFLGITGGIFFPQYSETLKYGADIFIKLIKMVIGPIVFTTLALGIAHMHDMKQIGRIGVKALVYFEVLTTVALFIGYVVVKIVKPGAGMNLGAASGQVLPEIKHQGFLDFLLELIPASPLDPFVHGNLLQVLVFALLFGFALSAMGEKARRVTNALEDLSQVFFKILSFIMYLAPVAVMGAMWFTVGKLGSATLIPLLKLLICVYITCLLFIVLILSIVARLAGFSLWKFVVYIKDEIFLTFATSSSETVLPRMMEKLEKAGCSRPVVGLVVPTGYSFNLDGTCIYLTMAAMFLAQATNTHLSIGDELGLLILMLLTSKGAAAVTGGGFVTLSATLQTFQKIPMVGLTVVLGIDRVLSEARAITNLIGNGVATMVIARWEKELDKEKMREMLK